MHGHEWGSRCGWGLQGLLPRLMRIPPGQAIVWAVSDQITQRAEAFQRARMDATLLE